MHMYTHVHTHCLYTYAHILFTPDDSYPSMVWHGTPFSRGHDMIDKHTYLLLSITKST